MKTTIQIALAITFWIQPSSAEPAEPLIAYVGTFSSPLRDVLPTQVDLPPGNGRGIHIFEVDRASGAMRGLIQAFSGGGVN